MTHGQEGQVKVKVLVVLLCPPTLCNPMDWRLSGYSVQGILQARILEWVAIPFSRGSSWLRDWTWVSCIADRFFTIWATQEGGGCKNFLSPGLYCGVISKAEPHREGETSPWQLASFKFQGGCTWQAALRSSRGIKDNQETPKPMCDIPGGVRGECVTLLWAKEISW